MPISGIFPLCVEAEKLRTCVSSDRLSLSSERRASSVVATTSIRCCSCGRSTLAKAPSSRTNRLLNRRLHIEYIARAISPPRSVATITNTRSASSPSAWMRKATASASATGRRVRKPRREHRAQSVCQLLLPRLTGVISRSHAIPNKTISNASHGCITSA